MKKTGGRSRSAAICAGMFCFIFSFIYFFNLEMNFKLAYLMEHEKMSMIEALAAIVKARPIVSPNCGCKTKFYHSFI